MSRYIKEYKLNGDINSVMNFTNQFFMSNGFVFKEYHGEQVYQKGTGLMVGPKFVKINLNGDVLHFEAWVKFAILPGVYSGEMDLEGTAGIATKKPLKTIMLGFENRLLQMGAAPVNNYQYNQYNQQGGFVPQPPVYQAPSQNQPVSSAPVQNNSQISNFCPGCGNRLLPNATFCNVCGRKVK